MKRLAGRQPIAIVYDLAAAALTRSTMSVCSVHRSDGRSRTPERSASPQPAVSPQSCTSCQRAAAAADTRSATAGHGQEPASPHTGHQRSPASEHPRNGARPVSRSPSPDPRGASLEPGPRSGAVSPQFEFELPSCSSATVSETRAVFDRHSGTGFGRRIGKRS